MIVRNFLFISFVLVLLIIVTACSGGGGGSETTGNGGGTVVEFQDEDGVSVRVGNITNIATDQNHSDSYSVGHPNFYTVTPSDTGLYELSITDVAPLGNDGRGHFLKVYRNGGGFVKGDFSCTETSSCIVLLKADEQYVIKVDQAVWGYGTDDFTNTTYTVRVKNTGTDAVDVAESALTIDDFSGGKEKYYRFTATKTGTYQIGTYHIKPSSLQTHISWDLLLSSGERIDSCNSSNGNNIGCFFELTEGVEYAVNIPRISESITGYTFTVHDPFENQGTLEEPIPLQEIVSTTSEVGYLGFSYFSFTPTVTTTYEIRADFTKSDPKANGADLGWTNAYIGNVYIDDANFTLYASCDYDNCRMTLEENTNYIFQVAEYSNVSLDRYDPRYDQNTGYNGGQFDVSVGPVGSEGPVTLLLDQPYGGFVGDFFSFASSYYVFTPAVSGSYTFSLTDYSNPYTGLGMLVEDNTSIYYSPVADCTAGPYDLNVEAFCTVDLVAGTEYLIKVDSPRWGYFGSRYTITVTLDLAVQNIVSISGQTITLSSVMNTDLATSYSWLQTGGPSVTLINADTAMPQFEAPTIVDPTPLTFELTVTYSDGRQEITDIVSVRINIPPRVKAGSNFPVSGGDVVTLPGAAIDGDGSIVTYQWIQTAGPTVTLSDNAVAQPTFTAPVVTDTTSLTFELTVTDNDSASATASVVVTVIKPLVLTAPSLDGALLSDVTANIPVGTDYSGNGQLTYTLDSGPTGMAIHSATGALTWTPTIADEGTSVPITVSATDGKESTSITFNLDVAAPTPILTSVVDSTITIDEPGSLQGVSFTLPLTANTIATPVEPAALITAPEVVVSRIPDTQAPQVPSGITRLSDFFRITPIVGEDGDLEIGIPKSLLPAGRHPLELKLYVVTEDADDFGTLAVLSVVALGVSLGIDTAPSDEEIRLKLRGINGQAFIGIESDPAQISAPDVSNFDVNCSHFPYGNETYDPYMLCTKTGVPSTEFEVLVKNFASNKWATKDDGTKVSIKELVDWLYRAKLKYQSIGMPPNGLVTVEIEPLEEETLGRISSMKPDVLHINSQANYPIDEPKDWRDIKAAVVHEYFHNAQHETARTIQKNDNSKQNLMDLNSGFFVSLGTKLGLVSKNSSADWIKEGTARWIENEIDQEFDDENLYRLTLYKPMPKVLAKGLHAIPPSEEEKKWLIKRIKTLPIEEKRKLGNAFYATNSYHRALVWKMFDRYCSQFDVKGVLNANLTGDPNYSSDTTTVGVGLVNLKNRIENKEDSGWWNCDFKDADGNYPLGLENSSSFASALALYQDISVRKNNIKDLDMDGDIRSFTFDTDVTEDSLELMAVFGSDTNPNEGSADFEPGDPLGPKLSRKIPPAGALSYTITPLTVGVPTGARRLFLQFKNDNDIWINVRDVDGITIWSTKNAFAPGVHDIYFTEFLKTERTDGQVPKLFITIVNSSTSQNANVEYGFGLRTVGATVKINQTDPNFEVPADIRLYELGSPTDIYSFSANGSFPNSVRCNGERGYFTDLIDADAIVFPARQVDGFPQVTNGWAVSEYGCSNFIAIKNAGTPNQKVWINATARHYSIINGFTRDFEYQIRFYSGDPNNPEDPGYLRGGTTQFGATTWGDFIQWSEFTDYTIEGNGFSDYPIKLGQ